MTHKLEINNIRYWMQGYADATQHWPDIFKTIEAALKNYEKLLGREELLTDLVTYTLEIEPFLPACHPAPMDTIRYQRYDTLKPKLTEAAIALKANVGGSTFP